MSCLLANQIWQCLDLEFFDGSEVLAEQLVGNSDTPDTRYLLGYVQYRRGQYDSAKLTCQDHLGHPGCLWVYAQSCLRTNQAVKGIAALEKSRAMWALDNDLPLPSPLGRGELSPAAFYLLSAKLKCLIDPDSALEDYTTSTRLNPYLFENVMALCQSAKVRLKTTNLFSRFEDAFDDAHTTGASFYPPTGSVHSTNGEAGPPGSDTHPEDLSARNIHIHKAATSTPRRVDTPNRIFSTPVGGTPMGTAKPSHPITHAGAFFGPSPGFGPPSTNSLFGGMAGSGSVFGYGNPATAGGQVDHPMECSDNSVTPAPLNNAPAVSFAQGTTPGPSNRVSSGSGLFQTPTHKTGLRNSSGNGIGGPPAPASMSKVNIKAGGGGAAVFNRRDRMHSLSFKRSDQSSFSTLGKNVFAEPITSEALVDSNRTGTEALETLAEILELLTQAAFREALQLVKELAPSLQKTPFLLELVGRLHLELGEYKESKLAYHMLRQLQPDRVRGLEYMSTAMWHLKRDTELAMLGYELNLKGAPTRHAWQSWCALGNAFSLRNDTSYAIKCFQRATQLEPNAAYAYTLMGYEYVSCEESQNALASFSLALQKNQQLYNAWYGLGTVYYNLGDYAKAEVNFMQAIRLNPTNAVLLCFLGTVLEAQGQLTEAIAQFDRAREINPRSPVPRYRKAEALLEAEMFTEALKELTELEKFVPEDSSVHLAMAKAYSGLGHSDLAVQRLTTAQHLAPKAAMAMRKMMQNL